MINNQRVLEARDAENEFSMTVNSLIDISPRCGLIEH